MNRKGTVFSCIAAGAVLTSGLAWQPAPTSSDSFSRPLLSGAQTTAEVQQVVERSCQDCHSEHTRWPWYAHVRPVASLLLSDVEKGRHFLNFSRWEQYSRGQKLGFLTAMSAVTNSGRMPPRNYLWLHPESALSEQERTVLRRWAKEEAARIRTKKNSG